MNAQHRETLRAAGKAHAEERFEDAEKLTLQVLEDEPRNPPALLMAGISAAKLGKADAAVDRLQRLVELDPNILPAQVWLCLSLRAKGEVQLAAHHAREAVRLDPNHPESRYVAGLSLMDDGAYDQAREQFEVAAKAAPMNGNYHFALAAAAERLGDSESAIKSLKRAVKFAPNLERSFKLGLMELNQGAVSKAKDIASGLLASHPEAPEPHYLMGRVLTAQNKDEEAETHFTKALEFDADFEPAHMQLAMRFQSIGRFDESLKSYRKAIQLNPVQGSGYYGIVTSKKIGVEDAELIASMEAIDSSSVDKSERALLHYGLGKAYSDLKQAEPAMRHFDEANRLSRSVNFGGIAFNRMAFSREIEDTIQVFTPEFIASAPRGSDSDVPVFIVGMIRSGTTLMEHILSCHPAVGAAGEQAYWATNDTTIVNYAEAKVDAWSLQAHAHSYLYLIKDLVGEHPRITDKNPANVLSLGVIHLAYPNARIIHMNRNPVDTMLSIWMTAIRNPPPFACDKDNIAFAYREYLRAVEHWRSVLPTNRFMDVSYEDLVSDQLSTTRRVLDFIGLPWDEACALPEKNERSVKTPSLWQVRQKIHTGSVNKWKDYLPYLGPFSEFVK